TTVSTGSENASKIKLRCGITNNQQKEKMKQIKYFLEKFDGIWSVPLAMFAFWFIGYLMQVVFGLASGAYDMAFFQPLFLAIAVVITAANAAMVGMKFNFK